MKRQVPSWHIERGECHCSLSRERSQKEEQKGLESGEQKNATAALAC